jgi:hypothetical protein
MDLKEREAHSLLQHCLQKAKGAPNPSVCCWMSGQTKPGMSVQWSTIQPYKE